jgi:hypothetical protein
MASNVKAASAVATMSDADKAAAYDDMMAKQGGKAGADAPPRYRVVVSLKTAGDRVLMSSVNKRRAEKWVEDHCPRGQHFFLQSPDGSMMAYEQERLTGGPQGEDIEAWQPFDRDAYQAPDLAPVNVNDPWADAWEGAQ